MFYMLLQKFATVLLHKIKYMQRLHTDGTAVLISCATYFLKRSGDGGIYAKMCTDSRYKRGFIRVVTCWT